MTNTKTTKRALLASILSLVICLSMLASTTFAWFTDTASTGVNTIQSGTLDVGLEMLVDGKWVDAEGETLNFIAADGNKNILWEPGCTYELPKLRVVNNGNLALKYEIIISGIKGDAKLNEAIDWTITGTDNGALAAGAKGGEITIEGHMKEEAGNEYQGLTIDGISITVVATQQSAESDSFNNTYDENAVYYRTDADGKIIIDSAAGLLTWARDVNNGTIAKSGMAVEIESNINLTGYDWTPVDLWQPEGQTVTINGNGHTITGMEVTANANKNKGFISSVAGGLTIKDLTFKNAVIEDCASFTGVVIGYAYGPVTLNNVDVANASVKGRANVADIRIGGLIGFVPADSSAITIDADCSVTDSDFYGYHNVAGLVGSLHATGNTVNGTVTGCTFTLCSTSANAKKYTNSLYVDAGFTRDYTVDNNGNNKFFFAAAAADQDALNAAFADKDVAVVSLAAGSTYELTSVPAGKTIMGNGATVTVKNSENYDRLYADGSTFVDVVFNGTGNLWTRGAVTYENCTFNQAISNAEPAEGTAKFVDCTFNKAVHYSPASKGAPNVGEFVAENCTFNGNATFQGFEHLYFTNCSFSGSNWAGTNMIVYSPATFDSCTWTLTNGVRAAGNPASDFTFINCSTNVTNTK